MFISSQLHPIVNVICIYIVYIGCFAVNILHLAVYFIYIFGRKWLPLIKYIDIDECQAFIYKNRCIKVYANSNPHILFEKSVSAKYCTPNIICLQYFLSKKYFLYLVTNK